MSKKGELIDWMDVRTWRFWFRTEKEAKWACDAISRYLGPKQLEVCKCFKKELRIRFTKDVERPPDIGVVPAGPRLIRVHFANVQFLCCWFVYRQTVYDLTFDGKPDTKGKQVILNE